MRAIIRIYIRFLGFTVSKEDFRVVMRIQLRGPGLKAPWV